jgi:diguanylate cyclase (GGDEF)-like protein
VVLSDRAEAPATVRSRAVAHLLQHVAGIKGGSTMVETVSAVETGAGDDAARSGMVVVASSPTARVGQSVEMSAGSEFVCGRAVSDAQTDVLGLAGDDTLSRRHARIAVDDDGGHVVDLGSRNGTWVNGRRTPVDAPWPLAHGDRIQVGRTILLWLWGSRVEQDYHRAMRDLVDSDPLTGCASRRRFESELLLELRRAARYGRPVACVLFDLDGFKQVNDRFGHAAGDLVLRAQAELCRGLVRTEQLVARLGGDEFAVLCPEADLADGARLAERLRAAIANSAVPWNEEVLRATGSFGVAVFDRTAPASSGGGALVVEPGADTVAELVSAADARMYAAKRAGGNRVEA